LIDADFYVRPATVRSQTGSDVEVDTNTRTNNKVLDITLAMFNYVRTMLNMQAVEDETVTYWCMQV
jgi:hypothetical protein